MKLKVKPRASANTSLQRSIPTSSCRCQHPASSESSSWARPKYPTRSPAFLPIWLSVSFLYRLRWFFQFLVQMKSTKMFQVQDWDKTAPSIENFFGSKIEYSRWKRISEKPSFRKIQTVKFDEVPKNHRWIKQQQQQETRLSRKQQRCLVSFTRNFYLLQDGFFAYAGGATHPTDQFVLSSASPIRFTAPSRLDFFIYLAGLKLKDILENPFDALHSEFWEKKTKKFRLSAWRISSTFSSLKSKAKLYLHIPL